MSKCGPRSPPIFARDDEHVGQRLTEEVRAECIFMTKKRRDYSLTHCQIMFWDSIMFTSCSYVKSGCCFIACKNTVSALT